MFQQQQQQQQSQTVRGNGAGMQPPHLIQSQSDIQAKEKLTTLIYEYLTITGATKTAETFKEEILNNNPSLSNIKPPEKGPSFLLDWWTVFWDLYCAAPERRDLGEGAYTQEAKYFHDNLIGGFGPPGMNGGPFGPHGMSMGGPEAMMGHPAGPGFPGRFPPNRMPPGGMPPAGFGMFPGDPRMARMPANSMRMPAGSFPGAPPAGAMRPGPGPGPGAPQMPGMPRYQGFMENPGPGGFPGASGSNMMPNGAGMPPMSMSSPGMPPHGNDPSGAGQPPFMGMPGGMPTSSSAMPFPMNDQSIPPSSAANNPPTSSVDVSNNVPGMPSSIGAPTSLTNGEEIKSSPVSTPRGAGLTGGTPAPGSAQSAAPAQPATPSGGPPSHPPLSAGAPAPNGPATDIKTGPTDDSTEISKIKEGLLDGFIKSEGGAESAFFA